MNLKDYLWQDNKPAFLTNVALAVAFCFGAVLFFFKVYLPAETHHGQTITVPDIDSMSIEQAAKDLKNKGLRYEVYDSAAINYDPDLAPGTILSHTPEANTKVKANRKIYLTVNPTKPPSVLLPNVLNSSLKNAVIRLRNIGVDVGIVERIPDPSCPSCVNNILAIKYKGRELSRDEIESGFKILKGTSVDLSVGDGLGNATIEVPNVVNMPVDEAEFMLRGVGLGVGKIKYVASDTIPGIVIQQYPYVNQEGKNIRIRLGRTVNLWVSEHKPN